MKTYGLDRLVPGGDLRGAVLKDVDLEGFDLEGVDLSGAKLTDVDFEGAVLKGACFDGAVILRSSFYKAQLTSSSFRGAVVACTTFEEAIMAEAVLEEATFFNCDFEGTSLSKANLRSVDLCDRRGRVKADVNLHFIHPNYIMGVNFQGADLRGVLLDRSQTFRSCNLYGAMYDFELERNFIDCVLQMGEVVAPVPKPKKAPPYMKVRRGFK